MLVFGGVFFNGHLVQIFVISVICAWLFEHRLSVLVVSDHVTTVCHVITV